jgi:hypothetical protein
LASLGDPETQGPAVSSFSPVWCAASPAWLSRWHVRARLAGRSAVLAELLSDPYPGHRV